MTLQAMAAQALKLERKAWKEQVKLCAEYYQDAEHDQYVVIAHELMQKYPDADTMRLRMEFNLIVSK